MRPTRPGTAKTRPGTSPGQQQHRHTTTAAGLAPTPPATAPTLGTNFRPSTAPVQRKSKEMPTALTLPAALFPPPVREVCCGAESPDGHRHFPLSPPSPLASPGHSQWTAMPALPHPVETHGTSVSRQLLAQLRAKAEQEAQGEKAQIVGRSHQNSEKERWDEMQAWCGFLATNLEGACCRIERLCEKERNNERQLSEQESTMRHLEYVASKKNVMGLEQRIEALEAELLDRQADIAGLKEDLKNGRQVEMPPDQNATVLNIFEEAKGWVNELKEEEANKTPEEIEDLRAMPTWNLDSWIESMNLQKILTSSLLRQVRNQLGTEEECSPQLEQKFMQKLGEKGSREIIMALLRSSDMLDGIADTLWDGVVEMAKDAEEDARVAREREEKEEAERIKQEMLEAARQSGSIVLEPDTSDESEDEEGSGFGAVLSKATRFDDDQRKKDLEEERKSFLIILTNKEREMADARQMIQQVKEQGGEDMLNEMLRLQAKVDEMQAEADELRLKMEKVEEAARELEEAEEAQKSVEKRKLFRQRTWGKMEPKKKKKKEKHVPDAKLYHDAIKIGENARQLNFGTPSVFFRGLAKVVGRAGADAGDDELLMKLMQGEHCDAVDSTTLFEPPNYLVPTTSMIEWYAVADPKNGLRILGIPYWPQEQRGEGRRKLHPPSHFREKWDAFNQRLEDVGEPPLLMHGFIGLRLYTGPMYHKYNNVLRGVSVPGCKAPLEWLFQQLCQGNKYCNTLHAITASINKLSRVSKAQTVYRAPGGVLPKSFWEEDAHGICGGVEMGFMSTSTSQEAAMEYARYSKIKLIFEIKQGMVARGADVSWLSMYPSEEEVLFSPLTAMEVQNKRVVGSILVVELTPGAAPSALMEKSIEEKEEDARLKRERDEIEARERKAAVDLVAVRRAQWMNSMTSVKVSAEHAKRTAAEHKSACAATALASEHERAECFEKESKASAAALKAMREMKEMERGEAAAAERKRKAELAAKEKLQKAQQMGEFMKKAALRQRLAEEQEVLRQARAENEAERQKEEEARERMTARIMSQAIESKRKASDAEQGAAAAMLDQMEEFRKAAARKEKELKGQIEEEKKRVQLVKQERDKLQGEWNEADKKYKMAANDEVRHAKDPVDLKQNLHAWLADPVTAQSAVNKICQMVKSDPNSRKKLIDNAKAVEALVKAMQANPTNGEMQITCCAGIAALKVHRIKGPTGANQGGKKAADAGAFPTMVKAMDTVQKDLRKALQNCTNDDDNLFEAAKKAGANDEWLTPRPDEKEEEVEDPE